MQQRKSAFWQTTPLHEMTQTQWESLCDGCAKCCLVKLQDDETNEIHQTAIACKLLNTHTCRCKQYATRKKHVPNCLVLRPLTQELVDILPDSCAYRLLYNGKALPDWHPLVSENKESTKQSGNSVQDSVISELHIHPDDFENFIVD